MGRTTAVRDCALRAGNTQVPAGATGIKGLWNTFFMIPTHSLATSQAVEHLFHDPHALLELFLRDDEWGCQPDDVAVRGLGEEALVLEPDADVPGGDAVGLVDHNRVEETLPSHRLDLAVHATARGTKAQRARLRATHMLARNATALSTAEESHTSDHKC